MLTLLHRVETAPEPSVELFEEVAVLLKASSQASISSWWKTWDRLLDAQAWTSAAEMLVPDGFLWAVDGLDGSWEGCVAPNGPIDYFRYVTAAHPSLALLAAILKANGYE